MEKNYSDNQEFSVGLDIGTTKIVAIVGRKSKNGKIELIGVGQSKSLGVQNGIVSNVLQTINSIKEAITAAEKSAKVQIKKVTVGIAGKHIRSLDRTESIVRDNPNEYITEQDIENLKAKVNKLVMQPGEEIIQVLPQEYDIDSDSGVKNPIGRFGTNFGAKFHIIVGQVVAIKNIIHCIKEAGLEMEGLTLEPLASAEAVLDSEEKESGVALVDIGGGTTDIAIIKDDIIRHTCVIPYGGGIITEDIKVGCSIIEKHAELLKMKFGSAMADNEKENTFVTIPGTNGRPDKEISVKTLAEIIQARIEEILEMVNVEFKRYGTSEPKKKLISGIVLTGGGSNLKNLRLLTQYITGLDTRIGKANTYVENDKNELLKGPEYATGIGLLMESLLIKEKTPTEPQNEEKPLEPITPGGNDGDGKEGGNGGNSGSGTDGLTKKTSWWNKVKERLEKILIELDERE